VTPWHPRQTHVKLAKKASFSSNPLTKMAICLHVLDPYCATTQTLFGSV
jgi:hypothetical protein